MRVYEYFEKNSFHDSYISQVFYDRKGVLRILIVQLLSELNIDYSNIKDITTDDQVEIEVRLTGIDYICHEDMDYLNSEITSVEVGSINDNEIILVRLYNYSGGTAYREIYIRGNNLQIECKVLREIINIRII